MPLHSYPANVDLSKQSVEIPGSRKPGYSGVWKSGIWDRDEIYAGKPQTLFDMFEESVARHPSKAMFVRREILSTDAKGMPVYGTNLVPTSYGTVQARRTAVGSALLALERAGRLRKADESTSEPPEITQPGVPSYGIDNRVKHGARRGWGVGIWSKNSEEWQVVDLACHAYGLVGVPLYETLGPEVAKYITNHCPLSIVFATRNHLPELIKIAPQCPRLRVIVSMTPLPLAERDVLTQWAQSVGLELLLLDELEAWGKQEGIQCAPGPVGGIPGEFETDRDRVITLSYTSGTTGDPKGAVLTNYNMVTAAISNSYGSTPSIVGQDWTFLSFLPLAHIYERFLQLVVILGDGTVGLTTGDPLRLLEDAQILKPHFMAGVPRIYNRLYAAIVAQMSAGGLKGALLTRAVNTKLENWRKTGSVTHAVYDALVFRKIKALLGGNLVFISSGAAPLSPEVHEMLKIAFCCEVVQGCGMTETIGTTSRGIPWDVKAVGTCGAIQACNDVRLKDVPEMSYTSDDQPNPRGEICIKGTNVFAGYLHDEANTKKTFDEDGWLRTGDVGEIDANGRLKIIDRIKNVVKLSQGEYVALEKLEGMYALEPIFASLLVHGDSTRNSLIAYGVLDPERAAALVRQVLNERVTAADLSALETAVQRPEVKRAVLTSLGKIAKENRLNGFERIAGVHLTMQPFPEEVLTPTFKVKRHQAAKKFKPEIDAAYAFADTVVPGAPAKL